MEERYTRVPRTTLWLLPEGTVTLGGEGKSGLPSARVLDVAPFYVGKSLITNEQYEAFDPSYQRQDTAPGDDHPAVGVSFREAVAYCDWYARLSRKDFRLPTEVEWEYACRFQTTGRAFWGDDAAAADRFAWHAGNSQGACHEVESLRANPAGLHDLLGLAWEWTSSPLDPRLGASGDGRDPLDASGPRVVRGGSFRSPPEELSSSARRGLPEDHRADDLGFRIVRSF